MNIVAIIPARGCSKSIPKKNIKLLAGKPLIAYSIEQAKNSKLINKVVVSTDDDEIAEVAEKYGAEVIKRPDELATDTAPTEPVLQHAVKELEKQGYKADLIVLLQPTSPLREKDDIDDAIKTLQEKNADSLLSVCPNHLFLWKEDGISINYDYKKRPRRQDMEQYAENGSIYVTKTNILMKENNRLGGKIALHIMKPENSLEIDDEFDFWLIEQMMRR